MADEKSVALREMITEICDANNWHTAGQLPEHIYSYFINVEMLQAVKESQYEEEHPDWAKAIREDYQKIMDKREADAKVLEAAKLAESEGVKFVAALTKEQRDRLMAMLEAKPAEVAPVSDAPAPVVEAAPVVEDKKEAAPVAAA